MNLKIVKIAIGIGLSFNTLHSMAQNAPNCSVRITKALDYLNDVTTYDDNINKALKTIAPCIQQKAPLALLLKASILKKRNTEQSLKESYDLVKQAAQENNDLAYLKLAEYYKYGIGCKSNLKKAIKWYHKAHKAGNNKAAYSLGYMYLKGFGNETQNYKKALLWFNKSDYRMAKYWTAVCYYQGLGVMQNKAKAQKILEKYFPVEFKTPTRFDSFSAETTLLEKIYQQKKQQTRTNSASQFNNLLGEWQGNLLEFDWSATKIISKTPLTLHINKNENSIIQTTWTINKQEHTLNYQEVGNSHFYEDFNLILNHNGLLKQIPSKLLHQIKEIEFEAFTIDNMEYIVAEVKSYIPSWKEKGSPIKLLLKKVVKSVNSSVSISDHILKGLKDQNDEHLKIYPNPWLTEFAISYELDSTQYTEVSISDMNGLEKKILKPRSLEQKGTHIHIFNEALLRPSIYILRVKTDKKEYKKTIIKKN